ncbi:MAG: hypothetical protein GY724_12300 [Actinomycetia bacterium]|nr:hypothetical protein [Actinomycetes bacterium]MCP5033379.1 hypothetical protein [Actinomycetes bacterium]
MSDLSKARGLNSIADPRKFKGSAGRGRPGGRPTPPESAPPEFDSPEPHERSRSDERDEPRPPIDRGERTDQAERAEHTERYESTDVADRSGPTDRPKPAPRTATPHRAVTPGIQRKRRELSIPHSLAQSLDATGINPADVVMKGYRKHSDAIYAGEGGRMMAKGRTRLRLSISDTEFDQITRLGLARGWNRSETVSVILALELAPVLSVSALGADTDGTGLN